MIDLSLVIPCYNEEPHLLQNFKRILWVLQNLKIRYEIIFVEDSSLDNTKKVIQEITEQYKNENISHIFHESNIGRGGSVNEGIMLAKGEVVGFLDIDLEVSEAYIPTFYWKIKEGADVMIAKRSYEFTIQKIIRFIATKAYARLVRFMLKSPFSDTEAGYKFFNREKILPIVKITEDKKWFWDTEIIMRSFDAGLRIEEVSVVFVRNPEKKSTVKIFPDSVEYFKKLMNFRNVRYNPK